MVGLKDMFVGAGSPSSPPPAPAPIVQPTANNSQIQAAQQQNAAANERQSGRMSTILTNQNNTGAQSDTLG